MPASIFFGMVAEVVQAGKRDVKVCLEFGDAANACSLQLLVWWVATVVQRPHPTDNAFDGLASKAADATHAAHLANNRVGLQLLGCDAAHARTVEPGPTGSAAKLYVAHAVASGLEAL